MFLYNFELDRYSKVPKITMKKIEVEEKPKTYYPKERWSSRIRKDEIDCITGYSGNTVYLLENNFERAKELFAGKMKSDISRIESAIESKQNELSDTERKLEILERLNSVESEEN